MSIKVNLKGDSKEFESGVSVAEIAKSIVQASIKQLVPEK